jgi:hypothetical protein
MRNEYKNAILLVNELDQLLLGGIDVLVAQYIK